MRPTNRLTGTLISRPGRARDRRCLDAAVAAAALAASADGPISAAKRRLMRETLEGAEDLRAFDVRLAVECMDQLVRLIRARGERGRSQALAAVSEIAGDAEGVRLVLRVAGAMARASGAPSQAARARLALVAAAAGAAVPVGDGHGPEAEDGGDGRPRVIALAGAKGGTGKSTTAVHLAAALVKLGHRVGTIDLDGSQGTLSHYLANRTALAEETGRAIGLPRHRRIEPSLQAERDLAEAQESAQLAETMTGLTDCRYVVIDTPGHDCHLARLGRAQADVLITPLNDSLLDVETLARIDRRRREVLGPSDYSKGVWEENDRRVGAGREPLDWIVMRNRLAHIEARNNREVSALLRRLAPRIGFRLERGLSERVAFRELFLQGLTVLDLPEPGTANPSVQHARREVDDLLRALGALSDPGRDQVAAGSLFGAIAG